MLELSFILDNVESVRLNCERRGVEVDLDLIQELARRRSSLIKSVQELRHEQKKVGNRIRDASSEERKRLVERATALKEQISDADEDLETVEERLREEQRKIPNMSHPSAAVGLSDADNQEVRRWGEPPDLGFEARDHVGLGEALELLDFEGGSRVTGSNFYFLKNEAVILELALVRFALDRLRDEGFTMHTTPDLARLEILDGTGFSPRGEESQIYCVDGTDLGLIATAEVTLAGLLQDSILSEEELPVLVSGLSHCFRREAGAYGRVSRGLYRVHQFTKVEMFAFTTSDASEGMLDRMVGIEEGIYRDLGVPHRVVECCTGELGGPAYRKYDIEAWMPGRGEWGEITSASNCTDYQARRLGIRYRPGDRRRPEFVHTLNGTAIATSRTLIVLMENYQRADGSIDVPEVLRPLTGFERIEPRDSG